MNFNLTPPPESTAVEFIEQTLTDAQKAQARTNIGALDSSSLVSTLTMLGYTKVATGSYVGDGQGSIELGLSADDIIAKSTNARKIQLPFAPNVILLINQSTGQSIIITSGAPLNTYANVLRSYDGYTHQYWSSGLPIAFIDGTFLSLVTSVSGFTNGATSFQVLGLYESDSTSSTSSITYNEAGYTYYYLAF